jgi:hypothetical protein
MITIFVIMLTSHIVLSTTKADIFCRQVIMEAVIVGLYLGLGLELPDKAARIRDRVLDLSEYDYDQMRETAIWKIYEFMSTVVATIVMPGLMFAHWLLGKLLRSGKK